MQTKLDGKVALVTGGSRGLGKAAALALADEGADVAISYVASREKAEAVVAQIRDKGVRAEAIQSDQGVKGSSTRLVADVVQRFGRLDILVNNAAIAVQGKKVDEDIDVAEYERQIAVNVSGVIETIRAAAPLMGDGSRIITVGSGVALRASRAGLADYAASKAAVMAYSRGAARDLGERNITVNVVHAGIMDTDMAAPYAHMMPAIVGGLAIRRFAQAEEVAAAIIFLASPAASYITGAVLPVDGGHSA